MLYLNSLLVGITSFLMSSNYLNIPFEWVNNIFAGGLGLVLSRVYYQKNKEINEKDLKTSSFVGFILKLMIVNSLIVGVFKTILDSFNITSVPPVGLIILFLITISVISLGLLKNINYFTTAMKFLLNKIAYKFFNKKIFEQSSNVSLDFIDKLGNNGKDFEDFVANLYVKAGFNAKTTTQLKKENNLPESIMKSAGSGEQGVDVIVFFSAPQSIENEVFDGLLIQCKQYSNTVGNKAIQEIYTAVPMYSNHFNKRFKPIVYTNNYFTKPAQNLAKSTNVALIDRDVLPFVLKEIESTNT
jgi:HJR/Mrr/RecB family endonuclease